MLVEGECEYGKGTSHDKGHCFTVSLPHSSPVVVECDVVHRRRVAGLQVQELHLAAAGLWGSAALAGYWMRKK
jgi:hypothetical protein